MKNKNVLDQALKNRFEEHEVMPSLGSWEKLSSKLDEKNQSRKKLWYLAAASLATIVLVSSILILDDTFTVQNSQIVTENFDDQSSTTNEDLSDQPTQNQISPIITDRATASSKKENIAENTNTGAQDPVGNPASIQKNLSSKTLIADIKESGEVENKDIIVTKAIQPISGASINLNSSHSIKNLSIDTEISTLEYDNEPKIEVSQGFGKKLKDAWADIRDIKNGEEPLIDIRGAKDNLVAFASKGVNEGIQKLKINRTNDEQTED